MAEGKFFKQTLQDFTADVAYGGAVRHLADQGFSIRQIQKHLDYPAPFERIQKIVWEHWVKEGVVRLEKAERTTEKVHYVREFDEYGRATFRRVVDASETTVDIRPEDYVCCGFGVLKGRNAREFEEKLGKLPPESREFVEDIPWPRQYVWIKKDERIQKILEIWE